mmetsp:Transcript_18996/g.44396  ORF Transcript_18996/g.44396 Transcript_18996/m.44396 type:complete len:321 (+) Transcript_18996:715-1677(+)
MFLGFAFQAVGLVTTTAQKSAFLLYLNVKFVPLLAALLFQRHISALTWASALAAFCGTGLLAVGSSSSSSAAAITTVDMLSSSAAAANEWNVGDLWSIAAALASAMFILRMEQASAAVSSSSLFSSSHDATTAAAVTDEADSSASELNAACLWVVTALSALWTAAIVASTILQQQQNDDAMATAAMMMTSTTMTEQPNSQQLATNALSIIFTQAQDMLQQSWLAFLYLSGIATAVCNWLQTKAQRHVRAERACVVYAMDPVYGAVFSAWWLGESLPGTAGYVGAGLITIAAATNAFLMDPTNTLAAGDNPSGEGEHKSLS